jgi:hypothetical protein
MGNASLSTALLVASWVSIDAADLAGASAADMAGASSLTSPRKLTGDEITFKMKASSRQSLGEDICNLVCGGNKSNGDILVKDFLTHKVVVHFNVLRASMVHRVGGKCKGTDIVAPNDWSNSKRNTQFIEQHPKPEQFSGGNSKGPVFSFGVGTGNYRLLLGTPRDEIIAKEYSKTRSGSPVIRAPSPIRITESIEL